MRGKILHKYFLSFLKVLFPQSGLSLRTFLGETVPLEGLDNWMLTRKREGCLWGKEGEENIIIRLVGCVCSRGGVWWGDKKKRLIGCFTSG